MDKHQPKALAKPKPKPKPLDFEAMLKEILEEIERPTRTIWFRRRKNLPKPLLLISA